jgi:hypothetical protein
MENHQTIAVNILLATKGKTQYMDLTEKIQRCTRCIVECWQVARAKNINIGRVSI